MVGCINKDLRKAFDLINFDILYKNLSVINVTINLLHGSARTYKIENKVFILTVALQKN